MRCLVFGPELDPSVFRVIELSRRQLPLLQNLRHLAVYELKPHTWCNITPFLGPKLSSFALTSQLGEDTCESMLVSLNIHAPFLEHLQVLGSAPLSSVGCGAICSLKHLRTLSTSCIPLTAECIDHLSVLSNLTELVITTTKDGLAHGASAAGRETSFASLRVLTISTDTWAVANDFCNVYLRPSSLCTIEVWVGEVPSSRYLDELFMTLRRCCPVSSLKSITLLPAEYMDDDPSPDILDPNTLRLLFSFSNLEELDIRTTISFVKVDNALVKGMTLAWPRLKSLQLQPAYTLEGTTSVTLDGLLPFASCSTLKTLSINLDSTIVDSCTRLKPGKSVCNSPLASFVLGEPPISDPCAVASFLSDAFPNLKTFMVWEEYDDTLEVVKCWGEARRLYELFRQKRAKEADWDDSADRSAQAMYVYRPYLGFLCLTSLHLS